jgi:hypothetical protein
MLCRLSGIILNMVRGRACGEATKCPDFDVSGENPPHKPFPCVLQCVWPTSLMICYRCMFAEQRFRSLLELWAVRVCRFVWGRAVFMHKRAFPGPDQELSGTVWACGLRTCMLELKPFLSRQPACNLVLPLTLSCSTLHTGPYEPDAKSADQHGAESSRNCPPGRQVVGAIPPGRLSPSRCLPGLLCMQWSALSAPEPWSGVCFSGAYRPLI